MSGLEVVGAIASVTQLGQYSVRLIVCLRDLSQNIQRSAKRFQEHQKQIDELRQIAEFVRDSQGIQSVDLIPPVEALLQTTETLLTTLTKRFVDDPSNLSKKWKNRAKGIQFPKAEAAVLKGFEDLERHKSTLTLALLGSLGGLIQRVDSRLERGIPELQDQVGNIERSLRACSGIAMESRRLKRTLSGSTAASFQSSSSREHNQLALIGACAVDDDSTLVPMLTRPSDPETLCEEQTSPSDLGISSNACSYHEMSGRTSQYGNQNDMLKVASTDTRLYTDNAASEQSTQLNGSIGSQKPGEGRVTYTHWRNNQADGQSKQINGDIIDANFASLFFVRG